MWKDLTLKQKAEIMKMSVANGVTDINGIQSLYDNSVENQFDDNKHLYKNAGPLDKAKQQPKYQYGIIEQILRENGVNFRVTSGARKPNQAGNAGKSSAHTYTIFGGSPGAIDIVPDVGSDWNTLFAQMSSPKVRRTLAAYGLDILNETNPSVMASTKATGPHLHVGRGIKGQQGLGQIFGGTSYGGGRGNTYRLQYPSQRNSDYMSMYSQNAFEPIVIGGNNTSNPWLDYIRSVESIGNQGINPVFNTPIRPTNTGLNGIKLTFTPTDFSSLSNSSDVVSPLEPYAAKQNIEYGLGLEGNALWNSPYLMFDNHSAANGGHLFGTAGQMLIRDNAVNPALRYVYGDDYEEYIRQLRNYRPANTERKVKPRYNLSQQTDVIGNTAKPVNRSIRNKQINSPQRQQKEQQIATDRYWKNERERQGTISQARDIVRDPVYNREFANEVQALREKEAEEAKKRYPVDLAMKQGLEFAGEAMRPLFITSDIGALFDPNTRGVGDFFANIWSPNNKGIFNINQGLRSWYDANPELAEGINLGIDLFGPGILGKAAKGVSRAGKAMATDFISDMRMLPSKYNTMRYQLAHPEVQTYGIIPNNLNTSELKDKLGITNKSEQSILKKVKDYGTLSDDQLNLISYQEAMNYPQFVDYSFMNANSLHPNFPAGTTRREIMEAMANVEDRLASRPRFATSEFLGHDFSAQSVQMILNKIDKIQKKLIQSGEQPGIVAYGPGTKAYLNPYAEINYGTKEAPTNPFISKKSNGNYRLPYSRATQEYTLDDMSKWSDIQSTIDAITKRLQKIYDNVAPYNEVVRNVGRDAFKAEVLPNGRILVPSIGFLFKDGGEIRI